MPLQVNNANAGKSPHQKVVYENFEIDRPGKIIIVGHHLSTKTSVRCLIRKMSLEGAVLEVNPKLEFPNNFFLEILGIRDEIGCTMISREAETVVIGFNMLINAEFLHHVQRLVFETNH